ncbi:MAG: pyridoxine 4-dehydrogenase [Solirubrobacterales bacterium]|jgi:aryl-alcohol dehydrogenase-like predicted oxidoreductase|nr:pyridoxine 4-dehydrogenase [Solirubrobacterales bacterium]
MKLGDREVKRVGLGTNRLESTPANRAFLREAVDAGLDHIDTAHLYTNGESERTIGEALAPFPNHLTVATKGGYHEQRRLRNEVEQSLESLRSDSIDLYYLHRVGKTPIEESVGLLDELRREGMIRNIGISDVSIGEIDRAKAVAPIAAVQNEFSLDEQEDGEVVDFCAVEGIAFVPFFPLRGGNEAVNDIARSRGLTPSQVKLAWLLKRSHVIAPIPGTLNASHVRENLDALDVELGDEEFERLSD